MYIKHVNKEKHVEKNLEYYHKTRHKLIELLGGKYVFCVEDNYDLLEFDHINPFEKSMDISGHLTSPNKIKEELQKLQVLCKSSHRIKTRKDLSFLKFCGTLDPRAKLKFSEVIEIRNKYSSGNYSYNQLSSRI